MAARGSSEVRGDGGTLRENRGALPPLGPCTVAGGDTHNILHYTVLYYTLLYYTSILYYDIYIYIYTYTYYY